MTHENSPSMISLDWGTSSLRAWLLDGECGVLDSIHSGLGILKISDGRFEEVFEEQLGGWFASHGPIPAIASGMIGSRQGWCEAPYIE